MISRDEAARVAALAKLEMTGEELDRAAADLATILGYVDQLSGIDTAGVEIHPPAAHAALRDDEPRPSLDPAETFANAPDAERAAGLFRVPRVLGS